MSLRDRLDTWAERSRLNPYRLLVMPHPHVDGAAFDALLARTPEGGEIPYDLPEPKWHFLHWAAAHGLRHGYTNWAVHVRRASRYVFSIGADPRAAESWTSGAVYLLPAESFVRTGDTRELISREPPAPRAWLRVEPDDFPFRAQTIEHGAGASPMRVVVRHALRLRR